MNTKRNVAGLTMVAVVLMAAALTPSAANAQAMQGKFNLLCTTYWGNAVLPAGDYAFTVRHTSEKANTIEVRGAGQVRHMSLPILGKTADKSSLTLAKSNGVAVARSLYIAELGRTFGLPESKQTKELLAKSQPLSIELTKITVAADE
jgi:hypothetical protein